MISKKMNSRLIFSEVIPPAAVLRVNVSSSHRHATRRAADAACL